MPIFIRLVGYHSSNEKENNLLIPRNIYKTKQKDFETIPGMLIGYWIIGNTMEAFRKKRFLSLLIETREGMATADNDRFLRFWQEIAINRIRFDCNGIFESISCGFKWYPYNKGGGYKKWYGNNYYCVDWENNGFRIKNNYDLNSKRLRSHNYNGKYSFLPGLTWNSISSEAISVRYTPKGFLFDSKGAKAFVKTKILDFAFCMGLLNSRPSMLFLELFSPNLDYKVGDILKLPIVEINQGISNSIGETVKKCTSISKSDWDLRETSWDFRRSSLLTDYDAPRIETVIDENLTDWSWPSAFAPGKALHLPSQAEAFKRRWTALFLELHKNEEENNRIFIDLYGLQDELTPEVPYTEITILQEELVDAARREKRIEFDDAVLARQFVSYGVGCLMGRYSAEQDGLILADSGSTLEDFTARVPGAHFLPDADGVLPLTDEDDFADDLPTAFKAWLRVISGEHYNDNIRWLEQSLGRDLRSYFDRDFYKDHIKRYKTRPIYWMISSPSGCFRALMYLHRYTRDTVGKVLNDYVRPYRTKLDQKIRALQAILESASAGSSEKTRAKKRLTQLEKYKAEIEAWERDYLYPLALKRIELDLDDGVKVNYRKLSGIVEPIKQLEAKDEE